MTAISSTGVLYWDMYFILKVLPVPLQFAVVDIAEGSRDYTVVKTMELYRHVEVNEVPGAIEAIASTASGIRFYNYLLRIGYGTIVTEEEGKKQIEL
ncbi:MAG TPA: hypothetical protein VGE26_09105 [Sphingobacteriaceae bacterium]